MRYRRIRKRRQIHNYWLGFPGLDRLESSYREELPLTGGVQEAV